MVVRDDNNTAVIEQTIAIEAFLGAERIAPAHATL